MSVMDFQTRQMLRRQHEVLVFVPGFHCITIK